MQPVRDHCLKASRCSVEGDCPENCDTYKDNHVRTKRETRSLPCTLSDVELREKGDQLAQAFNDVEVAESQEKAMKSQFKAKKEELQARLSRLSSLIQSKTEMRDVEVVKQTDFKKDENHVTETRLDTSKVLTTRDLTDEERQRHLDFMELAQKDIEEARENDQEELALDEKDEPKQKESLPAAEEDAPFPCGTTGCDENKDGACGVSSAFSSPDDCGDYTEPPSDPAPKEEE